MVLFGRRGAVRIAVGALLVLVVASAAGAGGNGVGAVLLEGQVTQTETTVCMQAPYPVAVRGAGVDAATWLFVLELHGVDECLFEGISVPLLELVFAGPWSPDVGGCVDTVPGGMLDPVLWRMCLTEPSDAGGTVTFALVVGDVRPAGVSWHTWGEVSGPVVAA